MNESRIWSILTVIVIIAIVAGTWFLGIGPRLSEAATADSDRVAVEEQNALHEIKIASLQQLNDNIATLEQELAVVRGSVPQRLDAMGLLRQLEATAGRTGVSLGMLTFTEAAGFEPPAELPEDPQLAGAMSSLGNTGLVLFSATQKVVGPRVAVLEFLSAIQSDQRLMLVYEIDLPDGLLAPDSVIEATFTMQMFVLTGVPTVVEEPVAPVAEAAP